MPNRVRLPAALLLAALLLLAAPRARAQQILSVSTGVSCVSLPTNGVQFNCDDDPDLYRTTTMNLLVTPGVGGVSFDVQLTSLPQVGGVQPGTADTCTDPDFFGLCTASNNATITFSATSPTISYMLKPLYQSVPYAYVSETSTTIPSLTSPIEPETLVYLGGFSVGRQALFNVPGWYNNESDVLTDQNYRCSPIRGTLTPAAPLVTQSSAIPNVPLIQLNWVRSGNKYSDGINFQAITRSTAIASGPLCQRFKIQPRAQVSGRLKVTIVTDTQTRVLNVTNIGVGATQVTNEGDFMVSIQDLPVPDGFYGPYLTGSIVICGQTQDAIDNFTMVNSMTGDPGINPWPLLGSDADYATPNPTRINELLAAQGYTPGFDPYGFFYFVNSTVEAGYGDQCSQLGVTQDLYNTQQFSALIGNLASSAGRRYDKGTRLTLPYAQVRAGVAAGVTCAPQFKNTYLGLPIVTPCQSAKQMYVCDGNSSEILDGVLPPFFNRAKPNIWLANGRLYVELPNNIQYRPLVAFNGQLIQARGQVSLGVFDPAGSSCVADVGGTPPSASIFVLVCNQSNQPSNFTVSTTCTAGIGLVPSGGSSIVTPGIEGGECLQVAVPLRIVGPVQPGGSCQSTLLPINAALNIYAVKTSSITFSCFNTSSVSPPPVRAADQVLISALTSVPTPVPERMEPQTASQRNIVKIILYSFLGVSGLVILILIIVAIASCAQTSKNLKAREKVQRGEIEMRPM